MSARASMRVGEGAGDSLRRLHDLAHEIAVSADSLAASAWDPDERTELLGHAEKLRQIAERSLAPERTIAVIGTIKAGKSTLINALVGEEIVPSRVFAMTALPTRVRHRAGLATPSLSLPHAAPLDDLLTSLRSRLQPLKDPRERSEVCGDAEDLASRILGGHWTELPRRAEGACAIREYLVDLSDLSRLSAKLGLPFPFDEYHALERLPLVEVEIESLRGHEGTGTLTLLDAAGPNEHALAAHLKPMLRAHIAQCSAIALVRHYGQQRTAEEAELFELLSAGLAARAVPPDLYVLINRYDQRYWDADSGSEDPRDQIAYELGRQLPSSAMLPRERIFLTSARDAVKAAKILRPRATSEAAAEPPDAHDLKQAGSWELRSGIAEVRANLIQPEYDSIAEKGAVEAIAELASQLKTLDDFCAQRIDAMPARLRGVLDRIEALEADIEFCRTAVATVYDAAEKKRMLADGLLEVAQAKLRARILDRLANQPTVRIKSDDVAAQIRSDLQKYFDETCTELLQHIHRATADAHARVASAAEDAIERTRELATRCGIEIDLTSREIVRFPRLRRGQFNYAPMTNPRNFLANEVLRHSRKALADFAYHPLRKVSEYLSRDLLAGVDNVTQDLNRSLPPVKEVLERKLKNAHAERECLRTHDRDLKQFRSRLTSLLHALSESARNKPKDERFPSPRARSLV